MIATPTEELNITTGRDVRYLEELLIVSAPISEITSIICEIGHRTHWCLVSRLKALLTLEWLFFVISLVRSYLVDWFLIEESSLVTGLVERIKTVIQ